ncbi:unnamed protein product, partial [Rotaria sp. Silwood2]
YGCCSRSSRFTSAALVLHLGHVLFTYASCNAINDSTELSLKRPLFSLTITPPAEKCLSDSADEACITKIRLAIIDKTGNHLSLFFQNAKIWYR